MMPTNGHSDLQQAPPQRVSGTLLRINQDKGYGFIRPEDGGPDFFVHIGSLLVRSAWIEGAAVTFVPGCAEPGSRKAPPAYDVALAVAPAAACPQKAKVSHGSDRP